VTAVPTTAGPVPVADLGRTLGHEHVQIVSESLAAQHPQVYDAEASFAQAVERLAAVKGHGVQTIVDPTVMDLGRDIRFMARVAEAAGLHVVPATGVYGQHYRFLPRYFTALEPDALADLFVADLEAGIQGTAIKAAFLKCAVDEPGIVDDVDKSLRAIARAHLRTGAPIMAHSHPGSGRGPEICDVFAEEGVDLRRVQIAHTGDTDDLDYIERLLDRGVFIGVDRNGLDLILPTDRRNVTTAALCARGYAERMVLSQDATAGTFDWFPAAMVAQMAPNWKMTFVFETVIPQLRELGVTEGQVEAMLTVSSHRWLAGS
jgi:phosphotriesterase-related protein